MKPDGRVTLADIFRAARGGGLSDTELRLWLVVRSLEDKEHGCYADTETLAHHIRRSESFVRKARASMVGRGWLRVARRGPKSGETRAVLPEEVPAGEHLDVPAGEHLEVPVGERQGKEVPEEVPEEVPLGEYPPKPPYVESTGSTGSTGNGASSKARRNPSEMAVFEYWAQRRAEALGVRGPRMQPTPKRLGKIRARLAEGYTEEQLKRAVDAVLASDFHRSGGHTDIELICRDQAHVEQYLSRAPAPEDDFVAREAQRLAELEASGGVRLDG